MAQFSELLFIVNLLSAPTILTYKIIKYKYGIFLNPFFIFVILGYFYFVLSSKYINPFFFEIFYFTEDFRNYTDSLMSYYYLIILIFYSFSREHEYKGIYYELRKETILIGKIFYILGAVVWVIVIVYYGPELIKAGDSRILQNIVQGKISSNHLFWIPRVLFNISGIVVLWGTKNKNWALLYILPLIYGYLGHSKSEAFVVFILLYPTFVLIYRKTYLSVICLFALFFLVIPIIRQTISSIDDIYNFNILTIIGEVYGPRVAVDFVLSGYMGQGDILTLLMNTIIKIIPASISKIIVNIDDYYVAILASLLEYEYNLRTHIMGSPVAEAYYYGGNYFLYFSPIIFCTILLIINKLKLYQKYPGYIFLIKFNSISLLMMREGFYVHLFNSLYAMYSWYLWITILEWHSRNIKTEKHI